VSSVESQLEKSLFTTQFVEKEGGGETAPSSSPRGAGRGLISEAAPPPLQATYFKPGQHRSSNSREWCSGLARTLIKSSPKHFGCSARPGDSHEQTTVSITRLGRCQGWAFLPQLLYSIFTSLYDSRAASSLVTTILDCLVVNSSLRAALKSTCQAIS